MIVGPPAKSHLLKFADDTVLLSLLSGSLQHHAPALHEFVEWCDKSCLELDVNKNKEMVVTSSTKKSELAVADCNTIHEKNAEIVGE